MIQTEVPCNGCTACCRDHPGVVLHPEMGDDVTAYQTISTAHPDTGETVFLLATKENGECVYLGPGGYTIYESRPALCRNYDCRKQYLILPAQDRRNLIRAGLSSKSAFDAARSRVHTLSAEERKECLSRKKEFFS